MPCKAHEFPDRSNGVASPWSFNYFLIESKQAKFLLTDRDAIYARFALSASIFLLLFANTALALASMPIRFLAMNLVVILGGIFIPAFIFGAVERVKYPLLKTVYPIVVAAIGLLYLFLYFQGKQMLMIMGIFVFLVFISPVVAIGNHQTIER